MRFYALLTFAALATIPASAATYNAVTDFSLSGNPNGVWSYGKGTGNTSFSLLGNSGTLSGAYAGVQYWANADPATAIFPDQYPLFNRNPTGSNIVVGNYTIYADSLELSPSDNSDSILRFIAPTSGSYAFTGDFRGSQGPFSNSAGTTVRVGIFAAAQEVLAGTNIDGPETVLINFTRNLNAGDAVRFYVNSRSDLIGDSVALRLQVNSTDNNNSAIPEPSSMLLLATGVVAFLKLRHLELKAPPRVDR